MKSKILFCKIFGTHQISVSSSDSDTLHAHLTMGFPQL